MNEGQIIKQQARERLLSAELAEVLEVDVATIAADEPGHDPQPRRNLWLAAAIVLLGVVVAGGVAWLRGLDEREAAQDAFDPTDPWWESEVPWSVPLVVVRSPEEVAAVPAEATRITVSTQFAKAGTIEAVLRRDGLRQLLLVGGDAEVVPIPWNELLAHDSLRSLGFLAVPVETSRLRDLGQLPQLRALSLSNGSVTLDAQAAAAVANAKGLRHLDIAYDEATPEGLAGLAALPVLRTLRFGVAPNKPQDLEAQFAAMAQIRTLRGLFCDGDFDPLPAAALRHLRKLDNLVALSLTNFKLDDDGLAALPRSLRHLQLPTLDEISPGAIASLAEFASLRSLAFHHALPEAHAAAVRALLPKLPIECFDCPSAEPSEELWSMLAAQPLLRRVRVNVERNADPVPVFERALACRKLEVLVVSVPKLPTPEQLATLRNHPTLRRIVLCRYVPTTPVPSAAELTALRASVRADVECR